MFSTSLFGAVTARNVIDNRKNMLNSGMYKITLETLIKIDRLAKLKVPKDTGLLRSNIRIAIMSDVRGKRVPINKNLIAKNKRQSDAKAKIKEISPVQEAENWLNDISSPRAVHGIAYNVLPYAEIRDRKGGIGKPAGFLTNTGRLYKNIYQRKLKKMVDITSLAGPKGRLV